MPHRMINWPGLLCAVTLSFLLFISFAYKTPWWHLSIADKLGSIDISPLDVDITLMGEKMNAPIFWYFTLGSKFSFLLLAAIFTYYSIKARKEYSEELLDAVYKKPIYMVIGLLLLSAISTFLFDFFLPFNIPNIPIVGTSTIVISFEDVTLSVPVTASFTWVFWLALLCAGLALAARVYHSEFIDAELV